MQICARSWGYNGKQKKKTQSYLLTTTCYVGIKKGTSS